MVRLSVLDESKIFYSTSGSMRSHDEQDSFFAQLLLINGCYVDFVLVDDTQISSSWP